MNNLLFYVSFFLLGVACGRILPLLAGKLKKSRAQLETIPLEKQLAELLSKGVEPYVSYDLSAARSYQASDVHGREPPSRSSDHS